MRLNPEAPYLHFRNPESKCFEMLYRGVIPDEPDDDDDFDLHAEYMEYDYYTDDEDIYDEDFDLELDDWINFVSSFVRAFLKFTKHIFQKIVEYSNF